jgi:hypothetical protein
MAGVALGRRDSALEICSEVCEAGEIFTRRSWALFITLLSDTWRHMGNDASQQFPRASALEMRRAVYI